MSSVEQTSPEPPSNHSAGPYADPIDALIPPPQAPWRRLVAGVGIVAVVAIGSFLWGLGYLVPQPDCCGSGGGSAFMSQSVDGEAITVTANFFNSSGRDLIVSGATADLLGADVLSVEVIDPDNNMFPTSNVLPFPIRVPQGSAEFLVTFVPTTCVDPPSATWGTVSLDLDVANGWLPSLGRTHEIDVVSNADGLWVLPPAGIDPPDTPLAAACALLGR